MVDYPNKQELELQERFINVIERIQAVPKHLWVWLALTLVVALPLSYAVRIGAYTLLKKAYHPPEIIYVAPDPKPIEILEQRVLSAGEGSYAAYARIKNPNSDLALRTFMVHFALQDNSGQRIDAYTQETYLLPGQDRVLVMPAKPFSQAPKAVTVEFEIPSWSKTGTVRLPTFFFENQQTGTDPAMGFFASGLFRNESAYHISEVQLTALAYNGEGRIVSANATVITDVTPRESRFFRFVWPSGIPGTVTRVEFQASINVLKFDTLTIEGDQFDENDPRRE